MSEDIKKAVELNEEELEFVAGGAYTEEEWLAMSVEERRAAAIRSQAARRRGEPCEID